MIEDTAALDLESWEKVKVNVQKAFKQGEKIPPDWWVTWAIIHSVLKRLQGKTCDIKASTVKYLHEYKINEDDKWRVFAEKAIMFSEVILSLGVAAETSG